MHLNPSVISQQAGQNLSRVSYCPKKLMLIHQGVVFAVTLLLTALTFYIDGMLDDMGGLSAMGQQAVWSTVQVMLELAVLIFLPLWQISLVYVAMKWNRGETADTGDLLQGLRRFGAVLRLRLIEGIFFLVLALAVCNIGSVLFVLTPFSDELLETMKPVLEQMEDPMQSELTVAPELMEQIMEKSLPLLVFCGVLCAVAFVLVFYRIRFADYGVMEGKGAIRSLLESVRCTHKNVLQVAKVDLFFWWFYLLQLLCVAVSYYGDTLLPMVGISLPFSADVSYFVFYILGALVQLLLVWLFQARVSTAYAGAWQALSEDTPEAKNPAGEKFNWEQRY